MENNNINKFSSNNNGYTCKDTSNVFLLAVLLPVFISLVVTIFIGLFANNANLESILQSQTLTIVNAVLMFVGNVAIFLTHKKVNQYSFSASKLNGGINFKKCLIILLMSLICIFGFQYLIESINIILFNIGYNASYVQLPLDTFGYYLLNVVLLAVFPAISEELIYRGVVLNGLRSAFSQKNTILISSLLFAVVHGNLSQLVYPFILGIILAVVVCKTNSLKYSILLHFLNNFIVVTFSYITELTGFSFYNIPQSAVFVLGALFTVIAIALLYVIFKKGLNKKGEATKISPENNVKPQDKVDKKLSLNFVIGIIVSVAFLISNIIESF